MTDCRWYVQYSVRCSPQSIVRAVLFQATYRTVEPPPMACVSETSATCSIFNLFDNDPAFQKHW